MSRKDFSYAYLYSNEGHTFLLTAFKQYKKIGGANVVVETAEIDHTVCVKAQTNFRLCIHNELVCHIAKTMTQHIVIYSDVEITLNTKNKGYITPRRGDIAVMRSSAEHFAENFNDEFKTVKNLKAGEKLFDCNGPVITKIKGEA